MLKPEQYFSAYLGYEDLMRWFVAVGERNVGRAERPFYKLSVIQNSILLTQNKAKLAAVQVKKIPQKKKPPEILLPEQNLNKKTEAEIEKTQKISENQSKKTLLTASKFKEMKGFAENITMPSGINNRQIMLDTQKLNKEIKINKKSEEKLKTEPENEISQEFELPQIIEVPTEEEIEIAKQKKYVKDGYNVYPGGVSNVPCGYHFVKETLVEPILRDYWLYCQEEAVELGMEPPVASKDKENLIVSFKPHYFKYGISITHNITLGLVELNIKGKKPIEISKKYANYLSSDMTVRPTNEGSVVRIKIPAIEKNKKLSEVRDIIEFAIRKIRRLSAFYKKTIKQTAAA
jgi:hypothetical protein